MLLEDFKVSNASGRSSWGGESHCCPPAGHNLLTSLKKPLHHRLAKDEPSYDSGALLLHTPRFQEHLEKEKNCPPTACQGSGLSSPLQSWNPLCPEAHWGVPRLTALKSDWLPSPQKKKDLPYLLTYLPTILILPPSGPCMIYYKVTFEMLQKKKLMEYLIVMIHIDFSWTLLELLWYCFHSLQQPEPIRQSVALRLPYFHHLAFWW